MMCILFFNFIFVLLCFQILFENKQQDGQMNINLHLQDEPLHCNGTIIYESKSVHTHAVAVVVFTSSLVGMNSPATLYKAGLN